MIVILSLAALPARRAGAPAGAHPTPTPTALLAPESARPPAQAPNLPGPPPMAVPPVTALESHHYYFPIIDANLPPSLGDLSSGWILMVDDSYIASRDVARQYHPFQKYAGNPILRARKQREGTIVQLYGTVFNGFRMWYSAFDPSFRYPRILYAESDDGLNWRRPDLPGQVGNTLFGGQPSEIVSVMHTPHDLAQPYKLVVNQNDSFWGFGSADGVTVTPVSDVPLWSNGEDVAHFSWNARARRYESSAKEVVTINGVWRRAIRFLVSSDFIHWTALPDLFMPDAQDEQITPGGFTHFYGMPTFNLGRHRLGLLWVLRARNALGLHGPVSVQLASSGDETPWRREEGSRPAILDVGPPGAWDGGQVYTASHPIKVGSELWLYYSGCNLEHGATASDMVCSIGLATLPYLRLASLAGSGTVLTQPLSASGRGLYLNYAAPHGEIRVELQQNGVPIPGYEAENCTPLSGDVLEAEVTWNGLASLPPGEFQIKFVLQNAAVFAFSP